MKGDLWHFDRWDSFSCSAKTISARLRCSNVSKAPCQCRVLRQVSWCTVWDETVRYTYFYSSTCTLKWCEVSQLRCNHSVFSYNACYFIRITQLIMEHMLDRDRNCMCPLKNYNLTNEPSCSIVYYWKSRKFWRTQWPFVVLQFIQTSNPSLPKFWNNKSINKYYNNTKY